MIKMNKLIIDLDSNSVIMNEEIFSIPAFSLFCSDVLPPDGYKRRVYYSGSKHYLKSEKSTVILNPQDQTLDDLFEKQKEISLVNKKIKTGQIKLPVKYEG